jgi:hypothetical protein
LGHSLPSRSVPAPTNVRCCPNRRQTWTRYVCPRSANRDQRTAAKYYSISGNSTDINGTRVPVEEPSIGSMADTPALRQHIYYKLLVRGVVTSAVRFHPDQPATHDLATFHWVALPRQ